MSILMLILQSKTLRIIGIAVAILIASYIGFTMWINTHDEALTNRINTTWQDSIKTGKFNTVSVETTYTPSQGKPTTQSKPGQKIDIPSIVQKAIDSAKASWTAQNANKDSLLDEYTAPRSAQMEDSLQTHELTYQPIGGDYPFQFTLYSTPKPQKIPTIHTTQNIVVTAPTEPINNTLKWNPRLNADMIPFTQNGLLGGISVSLWSYGNADKGQTLIYLPSIGIATNTTDAVYVHAGARLNIGYFIGGMIQDTHITASYGQNLINKDTQILLGIGTGL